MASDLSVANAARVSFARRKDELDEADEGLIRFLMRDRHGTPFEHNAFRFHVRCPIFVAREWFRHRIGCLTGDTEITFVDVYGHAAASRRKTIDELWSAWTEGEVNGHRLCGRGAVRAALAGTNERRDARWRIRKMRLRVLDEATNEFTFGHISDIFDKGIQPVYRLTLADGKHLTVTENHRLLTSDGWRTMRDAVGLHGEGASAKMTRLCSLLTNGTPAHRNAGLSHTTGRAPAPAHQDAIRQARFGSRSDFWRGGRTSERASTGRWAREQAPRVHARFDFTCQECAKRGGRLHAHHVIPARRDPAKARDFDDLATVCSECHRAIHTTRESERGFAQRFPGEPLPRATANVPARGWRLAADPVSVSSIEYVGLRQTYDLCVDGPWHNFVANGVVVHNSFNEFSMRYAKATDEFYVPEKDDVRSQVGKPGSYTFEPVSPELAEHARVQLRAVYEHAYATYAELVEQGVAREVARAVLPVGAYTEFYWTINARSLMNFVSLRAAETAQREIRRYADAVELLFADVMPVTHAAFVANDRTAP